MRTNPGYITVIDPGVLDKGKITEKCFPVYLVRDTPLPKLIPDMILTGLERRARNRDYGLCTISYYRVSLAKPIVDTHFLPRGDTPTIDTRFMHFSQIVSLKCPLLAKQQDYLLTIREPIIPPPMATYIDRRSYYKDYSAYILCITVFIRISRRKSARPFYL